VIPGRLDTALRERLEDLALRSLLPVRVAVLDSGIDATHVDLAGRIHAAFAATVEEGHAVVDEQPKDTNHDVFGHGTAVASIIARVAANAQITDYRVLGTNNSGAGEALVASLQHAIEAGHQVINMSLAARIEFSARLSPLCDRAYRAGQVVVAAMRNMPLTDLGSPAELTSVISVDRTKFESALAVRYVAGNTIEFVGHGDDVVVAAPGGGYTTKTGTSFATPAVSGIVALLLGAYPDLRPFEIKSLLRAFSS
jgi:subtilisin family serine protease